MHCIAMSEALSSTSVISNKSDKGPPFQRVRWSNPRDTVVACVQRTMQALVATMSLYTLWLHPQILLSLKPQKCYHTVIMFTVQQLELSPEVLRNMSYSYLNLTFTDMNRVADDRVLCWGALVCLSVWIGMENYTGIFRSIYSKFRF